MSINPISQLDLEKRIYTIRGVHVMLDSDLAEIYGVPTSRLNEQVKRNIERFPEDFMFKLSVEEWEHLISQFATSSVHGGRRKSPSVFTEQGVAGLSGVLKSKLAIQVHVAVMRAFIAMRKIITSQRGLTQRIDGLERKYFETEQKFERVFQALAQNTIPTQGQWRINREYRKCFRRATSTNSCGLWCGQSCTCKLHTHYRSRMATQSACQLGDCRNGANRIGALALRR
jgi:hypothetical protein